MAITDVLMVPAPPRVPPVRVTRLLVRAPSTSRVPALTVVGPVYKELEPAPNVKVPVPALTRPPVSQALFRT